MHVGVADHKFVLKFLFFYVCFRNLKVNSYTVQVFEFISNSIGKHFSSNVCHSLFDHHVTSCFLILAVKYQPYKMVKHSQTIRRQLADELFKCV